MHKPSIYLSLASTIALILGLATAPAPAQTPTPVPTPTPTPTPGARIAKTRLQRGGDPFARAGREVNLQETGHLHAVGEPGTTVIEGGGSATGTYDCSITVHLTLVSANSATATFTVRPHGGSVTGRGSARFGAEGRRTACTSAARSPSRAGPAPTRTPQGRTSASAA